jgi:hypothetical protein
MNPTEHGAQRVTTGVPWGKALRGAVRRGSLAQTTVAALIVGGILMMVNLSSQLRQGPVTWVLVLRVALTFIVPWFNATMGIAIGLRKSGAPPSHTHARPIER